MAKIRIAIKTSDGKTSILRLNQSFAMTIYVRHEGSVPQLKDEHIEVHGHVLATGRTEVKVSKRGTKASFFDVSPALSLDNTKPEEHVVDVSRVDGRSRRRKKNANAS